MTRQIRATVILPFAIDLRKEPLIIANLEKEIRLTLSKLRISQTRAMLNLPVIGNVVVKFDPPPVPGKFEDFDITFLYPYELESVNMSEKDKEIFYEITSLPLDTWDENWERIYVDEEIKNRALNYCLLMHTLRKYNVSEMTLAQHRLLIFYGPPGTGKTRLARGLANKTARELMALGVAVTIYAEINAHKLSSEWLGGSPKLVLEAFGRVEELATRGSPVICLIDEVESLLTNRAMALNETNPVDVFRAVNAVLQQIDRLAKRPNVYTFATSNLPKAIDRAFFDRADMLLYVGLPNIQMRFQILRDIFEELNRTIRTEISIPNSLPENDSDTWAILLRETEGLSGRQLRKLVEEALTYERKTSIEPKELQLEQVIRAAKDFKQRMEQDQRHGGVYEYVYSQPQHGGEQ